MGTDDMDVKLIKYLEDSLRQAHQHRLLRNMWLKTKFLGISNGWRKHCSPKCSAKANKTSRPIDIYKFVSENTKKMVGLKPAVKICFYFISSLKGARYEKVSRSSISSRCC
jgi:hypothetical protein